MKLLFISLFSVTYLAPDIPPLFLEERCSLSLQSRCPVNAYETKTIWVDKVPLPVWYKGDTQVIDASLFPKP